MVAGLFMVMAVSPAIAKDKPAKQPYKGHEGHAHAEGEGHGTHEDGGDDAMMSAWMEANAVTEFHKHLEPFVGRWETASKMRMAPEVPWMESKGSSEVSWIMEGRFVQEKYKGEMMGMPFEGLGMTGYDNMRKEYISTWMDSMSTTIAMTRGKCDNSAKTFSFMGAMDDPMTGTKDVPFKVVLKVVNGDKRMMEFWVPGEDGEMFQNMEIVYTRR